MVCALLFAELDECLGLRAWAGARRAAQADAAGADELLEPVRADELLEGVHLLGGADELEDDGVGADVGDASVERLRQRNQIGPLSGRRRDLQQRELALDRFSRGELLDAEHVHELVDLLLDLLEHVLLALDPQRDARHVVTLGRADSEALDVERTPCEHARDARQRAGRVLDEHRQRVLHAITCSSASSGENSTTSSAAAPAGIIGKQCSRGTTGASTTQVRPEAIASRSAVSSSSSVSAVKPSAP